MEIYQTLQTIREMFIDRGHSTSQFESVLDKYQLAEISAITNAKSIFSIKLPDLKTVIIYVLSSKQRINDIKAHIEDLDDADDKSYILIVRAKFNNSDQKKLNAMGDFQVFQLSELQFNISKHELVPKHELVINESEINAITEAYQLKSRTQLPFILKTDAMARYLNARPGNIVKITRISPSSGETIVYRCCV